MKQNIVKAFDFKYRLNNLVMPKGLLVHLQIFKQQMGMGVGGPQFKIFKPQWSFTFIAVIMKDR